jgi:hypothetical protein
MYKHNPTAKRLFALFILIFIPMSNIALAESNLPSVWSVFGSDARDGDYIGYLEIRPEGEELNRIGRIRRSMTLIA